MLDQLGLLLQRSVGATDAVAFSLEIDRGLARAEEDAKRAEEMERFLEAMPEAPGGPMLSEKLKRGKLGPPAPRSNRGSRRRKKNKPPRR